jgi:predicted CXXCH cytochrome family protein
MSLRNVANRKRLARAALAVGVIAGLVMLGSASLVVSGEKAADKEKTGIISPPDHAVLLSGNIDVICKTDKPNFEIDSQKHEWEFCGDPIRVARVRLFPGMHELKIGDKKIEIVVALNEDEHDGPADWKIQRSHKMDNDPSRCQACHEVDKKGGHLSVGKLKSHEACAKCHEAPNLKKDHPGITRPLENCQTCHALHGSPHKSLLKAPKLELLAECGDSNHSHR